MEHLLVKVVQLFVPTITDFLPQTTQCAPRGRNSPTFQGPPASTLQPLPWPFGGSLNGTLDALAVGASTLIASEDDEGASALGCLGGGPAAGTAAGRSLQHAVL